MPHAARKRSESGFYHVVCKGDGSQIVFEGEPDRSRYIELLRNAVESNQVKLHSYCLMSNHVHLLVQDERESLSSFVKQLNESYALHFRKATGRNGHVFQRPFWSEAINSDEYFLCALRYIHANPEAAGICRAKDYSWSSYQAHLALASSKFVEVGLTRNLLGGRLQFEEFSSAGSIPVRPFAKSKLRNHLGPDELARIALDVLGQNVLNDLRSMQPKERKPYIMKLSEHGFTDTEITRVTGLGRTSVRNALTTLD